MYLNTYFLFDLYCRYGSRRGRNLSTSIKRLREDI